MSDESRELWVIESGPGPDWVVEEHFLDESFAKEQLEWLSTYYERRTFRLVRYVPAPSHSPSNPEEKGNG